MLSTTVPTEWRNATRLRTTTSTRRTSSRHGVVVVGAPGGDGSRAVVSLRSAHSAGSTVKRSAARSGGPVSAGWATFVGGPADASGTISRVVRAVGAWVAPGPAGDALGSGRWPRHARRVKGFIS